MTRILTIIALLFATPAWAENSSTIMKEGKVLASFITSLNQRSIIISHADKIYRCNLDKKKYWCDEMKEK